MVANTHIPLCPKTCLRTCACHSSHQRRHAVLLTSQLHACMQTAPSQLAFGSATFPGPTEYVHEAESACMCEIWYVICMHACTSLCMLLQIFMLFLALAYGCQQRHRAPPLTPIDLSDATTFGQVIVDGGLHKLWPCLIPWVVFEASMGYAWLHNLSGRPAMSYHIASLNAVSCCAALCWTGLGWAVLCCAVLCCAVLCCAVLCCAVLCCAVLCCAVLCCAVLCCAVLCCAV